MQPIKLVYDDDFFMDNGEWRVVQYVFICPLSVYIHCKLQKITKHKNEYCSLLPKIKRIKKYSNFRFFTRGNGTKTAKKGCAQKNVSYKYDKNMISYCDNN